ncbi:MAG: glycine betaine/proline transport system substrate-binding protein [Gammaproteobacteria bacterium]|jgi:glycine betaine/proline transport system substrate-binding protein
MLLKLKVTLASMCLALSVGSVSSVHAAKRLTVADLDWTGAVVTCRTIQYVLENEMDYKVKTISMAGGPGAWEAVRSKDIDYYCETWPSYNPIKSEYLEEYGGDGSLVKIADSGIIGASGYFIPRYMVEGDSARGIPASTPNLKSYKDLNQYKHMFKSLESGDRGNLIGCPIAAWACEDQKRLDLLGVDFYAQALGSETAHWAEMQAKYKRGEPFIAYSWTPHWIFAALDLVEVELPAHDEAKWPATNWPLDVTFKFSTPDFINENPDVVQLLKNHRLTNNQQAAMIYEIDVKKRDMDEVVDEWMEANTSIWKKWIP